MVLSKTFSEVAQFLSRFQFQGRVWETLEEFGKNDGEKERRKRRPGKTKLIFFGENVIN